MSTRPSRKCKVTTKASYVSEPTPVLGESKLDTSRNSPPTKKRRKTEVSTVAKTKVANSTAEKNGVENAIADKKAIAAAARLAKDAARPIFERTPIVGRHSVSSNSKSYVFKALAWNVAGIRALLKYSDRTKEFAELIAKEQPDYLLLQEHKLQDKDVETIRAALEPYLPGYESHWSVSTGKKGYSGVAVFLRNPSHTTTATMSNTMSTNALQKPKGKQQSSLLDMFGAKQNGKSGKLKTGDTRSGYAALNVNMPRIEGASDEGRVITVEYPHFYLVGVYVPNSGQNLDRLDYRIDGWNAKLAEYLRELKTKKPVVLGGDLNVAHLDLDIYNHDAKHIAKSAGTTKRERESFGKFLRTDGMVDTFRHFNPEAEGAFTYWSMRVNNRVVNRGLRLDYYVASSDLMDKPEGDTPRVLDSWILHNHRGSDHCPIGLTIEVDNAE
eukprot:CFRG0753T1